MPIEVDRPSQISDPQSFRTPQSEFRIEDGHAIARGVLTNTLIFFSANFRGIFTFLIARVLGDAALGQYGLGFALTDQISKFVTFGFDSAATPLVARRAAAGDVAGNR